VHWPIDTFRQEFPDEVLEKGEIRNWYGYGKGVIRNEKTHGWGSKCTRLTVANINEAEKSSVLHEEDSDEREGATDELWEAMKKKTDAKVTSKTVGEGDAAKVVHGIVFTAPKIKKKHPDADVSSDEDVLDGIWKGTFASSSVGSGGGGGGSGAGPSGLQRVTGGVKRDVGISKRDSTLNKSESLCLEVQQCVRALGNKPTMLTVSGDCLKKLKVRVDLRLTADLVTIYSQNLANAASDDTDTRDAWRLEEDRGMRILADLRSKVIQLGHCIPIATGLTCTDVEKPEYAPESLLEAIKQAETEGTTLGWHLREVCLLRRMEQCFRMENYDTLALVFRGDASDDLGSVTLSIVPIEVQPKIVEANHWKYQKALLMSEDSLDTTLKFIEAMVIVPFPAPYNEEKEDIEKLAEPRKQKTADLQSLLLKYTTNASLRHHKALTLFGTGMALVDRANEVVQKRSAEEGFRTDLQSISTLLGNIEAPTRKQMVISKNLVLAQEGVHIEAYTKLAFIQANASGDFLKEPDVKDLADKIEARLSPN